MFSGNNNRSLHCPNGGKRGLLSTPKYDIYDGKRSLQSETKRTFVTAAGSQSMLNDVSSNERQKQHCLPTYQHMQKLSNNQLNGFNATLTDQLQNTVKVSASLSSESPSKTKRNDVTLTMSNSVETEKTSENFPEFINGIKQLVNGIIHPVNLNLFNGNDKKLKSNETVKLSASDGVVQGHGKQQQHVTNENVNNFVSKEKSHKTPSNATDIITLFTVDDFPKLPEPSRQSNNQTSPIKSIINSSKISQNIPENNLFTELSASFTTINLVTNQNYCSFEIEFTTIVSKKFPKLRSFSMSNQIPPFKTPNYRKSNYTTKQIANGDDDDDMNFFKKQKSIQMEFCDSDDDSDDDDCIRLINKSNIQNVVPGSNFGHGLSFSTKEEHLLPINDSSDEDDDDDDEDEDDDFDICFSEDAGDGLQIIQHSDDSDNEEKNSDSEDNFTTSEDDENDNYDDDDDDDDEIEEDSDSDSDDGIVFADVDVVDASSISTKTKNISHTNTSIPNDKKLKTDYNSTIKTKQMKTNDKSKDAINFNLKDINIEKQPDSGFEEQKKVRFNLKHKIHWMRTYKIPHREARKCYWETFARDRSRFQRRIANVATILDPILNQQHREKIYQNRFSNIDDEEILLQQK